MSNKIKKGKKLIHEVERGTKSVLLCNQKLENVTKSMYNFQLDDYVSNHPKNNKDSTMETSKIRPLGKWYEHHFGDKKINCVSWNMIFAMSKEDIQKNPKSYYEKLLKEVDSHFNPETGHYIERSIEALFHPLDPKSKISV
jgi:hypothetical protein